MSYYGYIKQTIKILKEYFFDFLKYQKYNYNNYHLHTQNALEAKLLRQTHVIEKGMSLSNPRKGFGQEKLKELFAYIDEYIAFCYPLENIPFQNAINSIWEYIAFQKHFDYENPELNKSIEKYKHYVTKPIKSGIISINRAQLLKSSKGDFKTFFESRHSTRQFENTEIDIEKIKSAVELAMRAPSACNRQAPKVYFFTSVDINKKLGELISGNTGFDNDVQKYLVVTSDISAFYNEFERNQLYVDGGIFTLALVEALHYYGIGSCILQNGEFNEKNKKFRYVMKIVPDNEKIVLFIAIGNYKENYVIGGSQRKELETVLKIL